ncbi:MAG: hypothetical protein QM535_21525 [Limnohabitans sp.]|nr:hypothetical protein [Limnohabitans sp.]
MKKNSILFVIALLLLLGCNSNKKNEFYSYIENKCIFENSDTCYIDLKDFFKVDYDTMYVFGEYIPLEGVRLILGMQDYKSSNALMPKGFLVEDSYNKIILLKDHNVVFDEDIKNPYFYDDGIEVRKIGAFDGEPITHYAKIFTTSKFMIKKKRNGTGYYYIYRNVLSDGSLIPYETIE